MATAGKEGTVYTNMYARHVEEVIQQHSVGRIRDEALTKANPERQYNESLRYQDSHIGMICFFVVIYIIKTSNNSIMSGGHV